MTIPVVLTGFEHGVLSSSGGGLFSSVSGTGLSIQGVTKHSGNYALKFEKLVAGIASANITVPNTQISVGSFYFRWHVLPLIPTDIFSVFVTGANVPRIMFDPADSTLFAIIGAGTGQKTLPLSIDTWHRIDYKANISANPWTFDLQLDGTPVAQLTRAVAPLVFTLAQFGDVIVGFTGEVYYDDFIHSATAADYPIGGHEIMKLSPAGAGVSNPGAVIQDEAGNVINDVTNPAYIELQDYPLNASMTTYVKQTGIDLTLFAAVTFEQTTQDNIIGVRGYVAYTSQIVQANNGKTYIVDAAGQVSTIYSGSMAGGASLFYKSAQVIMPVAGWSKIAVNGLIGKVGYSSDVTPNPYWQALLLEVAYVPITSICESLFKGMFKGMFKRMVK